MKKNQGFTLIEMMIVIMVIGILAAIAIPSYRHYLVKNDEAQVQSRMASLQIELDKWRASVLSYRGFTPSNTDNNGGKTYAYADATRTKINVPNTTDTKKQKYIITLTNGNGATLTSNILANNIANAQHATSWIMVAHPTSNAGEGARVMFMNSAGQRCMSRNLNFCKSPKKTPTAKDTATALAGCTCTNAEEVW